MWWALPFGWKQITRNHLTCKKTCYPILRAPQGLIPAPQCSAPSGVTVSERSSFLLESSVSSRGCERARLVLGAFVGRPLLGKSIGNGGPENGFSSKYLDSQLLGYNNPILWLRLKVYLRTRTYILIPMLGVSSKNQYDLNTQMPVVTAPILPGPQTALSRANCPSSGSYLQPATHHYHLLRVPSTKGGKQLEAGRDPVHPS